MEPTTYPDSTAATLAHSRRVGELMVQVICDLTHRSVRHDLSKTEEPERPLFDRHTPDLAKHPYGSPGYTASLAALGPALEHHFANNPHHPQHYPNGINGMTLADLVEMLADWRASTERVPAGSLRQSLIINQDRFRIGDQLADILENTARAFGWLDT